MYVSCCNMLVQLAKLRISSTKSGPKLCPLKDRAHTSARHVSSLEVTPHCYHDTLSSRMTSWHNCHQNMLSWMMRHFVISYVTETILLIMGWCFWSHFFEVHLRSPCLKHHYRASIYRSHSCHRDETRSSLWSIFNGMRTWTRDLGGPSLQHNPILGIC